MKLNLKYRTWNLGAPPQPIKLQIPGWAGEKNNHTDGDKPQPWFCPPFVESSTYGLELLYPFNTECRVSLVNGKIKFEGDFSNDQLLCPEVKLPPFLSFAPGHFGMTSSLDIKVPEGYVLRTEPHPRFYTDETNTTPCCIPGHIQTEWWPKIFFVVFKNPAPGQTIIFRKGEPYGQILIVPKKISYSIEKMNENEIKERLLLDNKIERFYTKFANNQWVDNQGNPFSDRYKVLSVIFSKKGKKEVCNFLNSIEDMLNKSKTKFVGKLFFKK